MIHIQNLQKNYSMDKQSVPILHITNLSIDKGSQIAITGPSGCGKSTLLHVIGGVIEADDGIVTLNDTKITDLSQTGRDFFRRTNIGYVFQDFHLIPSLTAEENIRLVLTDISKRDQHSLIEEWFKKVGLEDRKKHRPSQLSRGQQQRVAIIRALIHQPSIILADEPTGSLDFETAGHIMDLLLELCKEENRTFLCVTHDRSLAARFPEQLEMEKINRIMNAEVKVG